MATKRGDPKAIREVGTDEEALDGEEGDWLFGSMPMVMKKIDCTVVAIRPNRCTSSNRFACLECGSDEEAQEGEEGA